MDFDVHGVRGKFYDTQRAKGIHSVRIAFEDTALWIVSDKYISDAEMEKRKLIRAKILALIGCAVLGTAAALGVGALIGISAK